MRSLSRSCLPSKAEIKDKARSLGFDLVGVAPLGSFPEAAFYAKWLESGYAGEMQYLERQKAAKLKPESVFSGAKSVIVCAMNYNTARPGTQFDRLHAWVSRYAWGEDYHDTLRRKLEELAGWIEHTSPHRTKAYVDTGPLLERVYAKYAGVGWFGKNTCIINQRTGSWLFLGCILTDLDVESDAPVPDRCGSCTRCIDACPTNAIVKPYVLDSRRCIAYTTIELRGEIPETDREGIGQHLFGCDICQDVCPWNRKAPVTSLPEFHPRTELVNPELHRLARITHEEFRAMFCGSPIERTKYSGFRRNVAIAIGNNGDGTLIPVVEEMTKDEDTVVAEHAEWALRQLRKKALSNSTRI